MRVLHLCAGNLYGGVETFLVTLARYRDLGMPMEPHFALCFPGRLRDELQAADVPVYDLGPVRVRKPWSVWSARRRLRALLARERFDIVVVHSCWSHGLFAGAARRAVLPIVFWAHSGPSGRHWLERWARRTPPDLVIANSRFTAEDVPALFPDAQCDVIYLPVPAPDIGDRLAIRRAVRQEIGTADGVAVIVAACRMEEWKGHRVLVDALTRLRDTPGWICWIAGGAQRPREEAYLADLMAACRAGGIADRVRFLGQRADVPKLLAASDIHCQPNTGPEPFGITFVEALYAGLPVVTTAMGGALEIVDGTCGVLVPPGDVEALADELRDLICNADRRHQHGGAGAGHASRMCDPERQLHRISSRLSALGFDFRGKNAAGPVGAAMGSRR